MPIPTWLTRLPLVAGKRTVIIDNNVFSAYLFRTPVPDDVRWVFDDPTIRVQCGRQTIDEALNHPELDVARRRRAWEQLERLQASGKLYLSGTTQMTREMSELYSALAKQLAAANLSTADGRVFADAIVKRVPLFTLDKRAKDALARALNNQLVKQFLKAHSLPATVAEIVV